jgi:hypothetical protein
LALWFLNVSLAGLGRPPYLLAQAPVTERIEKLLEDLEGVPLSKDHDQIRATLREVRHQFEQDRAVIGFRFLCANLLALRFPLTASHFKEIERIGKGYDVEPKVWKQLNSLLQNNGRSDIRYDFGVDKAQNERLSHILNEACHVFKCHAAGTWQTIDKDRYAKMLLGEVHNKPSLIRKMLKLQDRVVKMVVYRAIDLQKLEHGDD